MRIVAVIDQTIDVGGGFSQSWNAVLQMARLCEGRHDYEVLSIVAQPEGQFRELGIPLTIAPVGKIAKALATLGKSMLAGILPSQLKITGPLERMLLARKADLVYFTSPNRMALSLQRLNYIFSVWDLCHRDFPEFPEVRSFGEFDSREFVLRNALTSAYLILTDSETSSRSIGRRYGVDEERLLAMPFSSAAWIQPPSTEDKAKVAAKYNLCDAYFFYPAQFWAHKNHARIIEAMIHLKNNGAEVPNMVFAGSEKGNRNLIRQKVEEVSLGQHVKFLGFVPTEDMSALYAMAAAVVMPTYFGPTNLPPLEAWYLGIPLVYSSRLSAQAGDAAILADPDDAISLADAMCKVRQSEVAEQLVMNGYARLAAIDRERELAEQVLSAAIDRFANRAANWH